MSKCSRREPLLKRGMRHRHQERVLDEHFPYVQAECQLERRLRDARLRAGPALGHRPSAERAGLLRRPRRTKPLRLAEHAPASTEGYTRK